MVATSHSMLKLHHHHPITEKLSLMLNKTIVDNKKTAEVCLTLFVRYQPQQIANNTDVVLYAFLYKIQNL